MHILILSCNTGGGHNSAAAALEEAITDLGHQCSVINALEFLPKATSELLSRGHNFLYRHTPWLFGVGYRFEEKYQSAMIYDQNAKGAGPLLKVLQERKPDAVICVHVFSAMMMTELRRNYGVKLPCWFVATDYTCSPGVGELDMDGFCIPHKDLTEEFIACGVPAEKIIPTGIPVRKIFSLDFPQQQARQMLGLEHHRRVVVLACGSMGAGPMRDTARCIQSLLAENDKLVAICGSNKRLRKQLEEDFWYQSHQVQVLGFTDQMSLYMHAADLLITKAGGLTTAEALEAEVPVLYLDAVPGCETHNLDFMADRGFCLAASCDEDLQPVLMGIQSGAIDLDTMIQRRRGNFPRHAAETIARLACGAAPSAE